MQLKCVYRDISILNTDISAENAGNSIYFSMSFWGFTHLMQISIFRHVETTFAKCY